jgi:hypothetical protein
MSCRLTLIFSKGVLRAVLILVAASLSTSAFASTNSGIDTPTGVTTLPLAVQGVEGMDLVAQPDGAVYVGIGVTSPSSLLTLGGTTSAAPTIDFYLGTGYGGDAARILTNATSNAWNASYLDFQTHATNGAAFTDDMVIKAGLVGVGTTAPQAPLDVIGGMRASGTTVIAGGACSPEGMFGYDSRSATHAPVYCNSSGVWTSLGGVPVGRTWHNVLNVRASGATYTNAYAYPIDVSVSGTGVVCVLAFYVQGNIVQYNGGSQGSDCDVDVTVPPGASYAAQISDSPINRWWELY